MTLDEAIQHCEEVADTPCFTDEEARCYSEHRQLAEWLKELKAYKEKETCETCETCGHYKAYQHGADITTMDDECGGCCSWNSKWIPKTCGDAISRQAVIDRINKQREGLEPEIYPQDKIGDRAYRICIEFIKNDLPSVSPQQRTGHWIEKAEDYYKAINEYGGGVDENTDYFTDDIACPKCLSKFSTIDNETERFRHCPKCGAKMEVKE